MKSKTYIIKNLAITLALSMIMLFAFITKVSAQDAITNGGFETGDFTAWTVLQNTPPPAVNTIQPHSGTYSAFLGDVPGPFESSGFASMYQQFTVPAGGGTLSYWFYPNTTDQIPNDWQLVVITDLLDNILDTVMYYCRNDQAWINVTHDMTPFAGQTIRLKFQVKQDGFGDPTGMYIDNVSLPLAVSITGFSPGSGCAGDTVFISGILFTGATDVQFNGVSASYWVVTSDSTITAVVPNGTSTGPITVITPTGTATSNTLFDVNGPTITFCPPDTTINLTSGCSVIVNYPPAIGGGTITYSQDPGSSFNLGTTTVIVYSTDNCGTDICSFNITVNDTIAPTITCPPDITVNNDPGICGTTVTYADPTVTDNCTSILSGVSSFFYTGAPQFYTVPTGVTSITVQVDGASGGPAPGYTGGLGAEMIGTFVVIPNTVLTVAVGGQGIYGNSGAGGGGGGTGVLNGLAPLAIAGGGGGACYYGAENGHDGNITTSGGNSSGLGGASGLGGEKGYRPGDCGWAGGGGGLVGDGYGGNGSWDGGIQPGTLGGPGAGKSWANGGAAGIGGSCGFNATLDGGWGCGGGARGEYGGGGGGGYSGGGGGQYVDISGNKGGGGGGSFNNGTSQTNTASVNSSDGFAVISYNIVFPTEVLTSGLASGSFFPVGTTTQVWTATDGSGNTSSCSFNVTVNDIDPPVITCPTDTILPADNSCTATLFYTVTATDNCTTNPVITQIQGFSSGSGFPIGTTTNIFVATDSSGNTATCSFNVTVIDAPTIVCPADISVSTDLDQCYASGVVLGTPVTADNCGSTITSVTNDGLLQYQLGTTVVTWIVTNSLGNTATCVQNVVVTDNQPPVISGCSPDITVDADPGLCSTVVTFNTPTTTDNCSTNISGNLTFNYVGFQQTWTVPAGVSSITVDAAGAQGGENTAFTEVGGNGGRVTGIVPVTSGQTLYIIAAGAGANSNYPTLGPNNSLGGYPNGGQGGSYTGGGGGGSSSISTSISLTNALFVAGGGGGTGSYDTYGNLGGPGGAATSLLGAGSDGTYGQGGPIDGYGGTQVAGGVGGHFFCTTTDGSFGQGGNTCTYPTYGEYWAGGGGGGWYGGGAGGDGGSGGGGSNYNDITATSVVNTAGYQASDGYVILSYSSIFPNVSLTSGLPSGSAFPVGTTTEVWTATDGSGNTATCSYNVTVLDIQPPVITCPPDTILSSDSSCTAIYFFTVTATDNCTITVITQLTGITSGDAFPIGTTTNTFVATDSSGNTATCSFNVTIVDAPAIVCPSDITVSTDLDLCYATGVDLGIPDTSDNCGSTITSVTNNAPSQFLLGTTTVTWTVTNSLGNTATCSQNVTVVDNQPPVISGCPIDITVDADFGLCSAVVTFINPTVTDNCSSNILGNLTFNYTGSEQTWLVPAGVTAITVEVAGAQGGLGSSTVNGTTNIGGNGGDVQGTLTVVSGQTLYIEVGGAGVAGINGGAGGFNGGGAGNSFLGSYFGSGGGGGSDIRIGGNALTDRVVSAGGGGGGGYNYFACCNYEAGGPGGGLTGQAGWAGNIQGGTAPGAGGSQVAGGAGGTFAGYCTANNGALGIGGDDCTSSGNAGAGGGGGYYGGGGGVFAGGGGGSSYIGGLLTMTNNAQGVQTGNGFVIISYSSTFPNIVQTSGLDSGATYPVGTTTNTFLATDGSGNTATCSFNVVVLDNQPPVITCPSDTVVAADLSCTATFFYIVAATDNCTQNLVLTQLSGLPSGSIFPMGTTTNTFIVTDSSGNTATCSFDVTVVDAPVITCPADVINIPADPGQCYATGVDIGLATAVDNCGSTITSITNNGLSQYPVGTTIVTWIATNSLGNTATCAQNIIVIDDQPPVITCPPDITAYSDLNNCSAVVTFTFPTATDNCGGFVGVTTVTSFNYTGSQQTWIVPAGVTSITVDATGAQGGENTAFTEIGGKGGRVIGIVPVTPGQTLYINAAGAGGNSIYPSTNYANSLGGYPNGGFGGAYTGGGGGGSSSISTTTNLTNALFVAGGGGGTGSVTGIGDLGGPGGAATSLAGAGTDQIYGQGGTNEGWGGTQNAGGLGGHHFCTTTDGSFGQGGNVCPYPQYGEYWAGGGGGGWYGGGAGGYGGSGGGGSNYNDITATSVVNTPGYEAGNGYVYITYLVPVPSPLVTQIGGLDSGSVFPVGTTTNIFLATDASGNTSTCSFNVTVVDTVPPVINCPPDITVNADTSCTATVNFSITATDNCSQSQVLTFNYSGSQQTWVVPAGVTSLTVDAAGGSGGNGTTGTGGLGGRIQTTITVAPAQTLNIYVGGAGGNFNNIGGFNGGGSTAGSNYPNNIGGGGGSSDIRQIGNALTDRVIVAGGGGGGGYNGCGENGGAGGGLIGASGALGCGTTAAGGGSQAAGGVGGFYSGWGNGLNGNLGIGGDGLNISGGAGGGGGYYGGGGGAWQGGGGGSSFSSGTNTTHTQGFQTGDGYIILSYTPSPLITQTTGLPSGSGFPVGTTLNTFVATDGSGNTATCSFTVTVLDAPVITCPANLSNIPADNGQCYATGVNIGTPTVVDNCGSAITSVTNDAPGQFAVGTTTVTWIATNSLGNTASCAQTVTVIDNQPPVISNCPSDITAYTGINNCDAIVTFTPPTATDNCGGNILINYPLTYNYTGSIVSYTVPAGVTSLTITALGASGGSGINYGSNPGLGAQITGTVNVNSGDVIDILIGQQGFQGNAPFYSSGGGGGGSFIWDVTQANTLLIAAGGGGGSGYYTFGGYNGGNGSATATPTPGQGNGDGGGGAGGNGGNGGGGTNCNIFGSFPGSGGGGAGWYSNGGNGTIIDMGSGGMSPLNGGAGGVGIGAYAGPGGFGGGGDAEGNGGAGGGGGGYNGGGGGNSFDCTLYDWGTGGGGGSYNSGTNQTNLAGVQTGNGQVLISYSIAYPSPLVTQTAGLPSGSTYPIGVTTNTFTATDSSGNTATCTFTVTVLDTIPPTITCPSNITVNNTLDSCGAMVCYNLPTATDNCGSTGILTFNYTGTISNWTIPTGVTTLTIVTSGASGGPSTVDGVIGGNGATISGTVTVTPGDVLGITVGGQGGDGGIDGGGGGGGSFVWDNNTSALLQVGGGGGGAGYISGNPGADASLTTTPTIPGFGTCGAGGSGELGGSGGTGYGPGAGGAGFLGNGGNSIGTLNATGGNDYANGFGGGIGYGGIYGTGGFGGGGGGGYDAGSGGGGYNGAGGGDDPNFAAYGGGGGGSYCGGILTNAVQDNTSNGYVIISYNIQPTITLVSGQDPCTAFPVGTTTNVYMATDVNGNTATCSFTVTVIDNQIPTVVCRTDTSLNLCTYTVISTEFDPISAADNCAITSEMYTLTGATTGSGSNTLAGVTFNSGVTNITWTVTDASGNTASCSFNVTIIGTNPTPVITANGPTTFCTGGSVILSAGIYTSYLWSTGETTDSITVTTAGIYTVTVTNSSGCTGTASITITVTSGISPTITVTGALYLCQGDSTILSAGNYSSYIWSTGATTDSIIVTTSGTYSVTVTNSFGCTGSDSRTVTVYALPIVSFTGLPDSVCNNAGNFLLIGNPVGGGFYGSGIIGNVFNPLNVQIGFDTITFYYTDIHGCYNSTTGVVRVDPSPTPGITANGPVFFCQGDSVILSTGIYTSYLWSNGATTSSITVTSSGTYTVTATNNFGCTGTDSMTVTVYPTPIVSFTGLPLTACSNSGTYLLTGVPPGGTFGGSGITGNIFNAGTAQLGMDTITYFYNGIGGCVGTSQQVVDVFASPVAHITPASDTTFCQGGTVLLDAGTYPGYVWSNGATTETIIVNASGTYSVTVTGGGGCTGVASILVTVNPVPATPVLTITGATYLCQGDSVILSTTSGYTTYAWSNGATTQSITVIASGAYDVTVSNGFGCTAVSASQQVTVYPLPIVSFTGLPDSVCANAGNFPLTGVPAGGGYYGAGMTGNIFNPINAPYGLDPISYYFTDIHGCYNADTQYVQVDSVPAPIITAAGPTTFCQGGSVVLSTGNYAGYSWSTGETTQSITVTTGGNYRVTVTAATGGCTGVGTITITVNPNPTPVIAVGGPTFFCQGDSVILTASLGVGYSWSTGSSNQSIWVNATGTYSVTITNSFGCTASTSQMMTMDSLPIVSFTGLPDTVCYYNGNFTLTGTPAGGGFYGAGISGNNFNPINAPFGNNVITYYFTNANGCYATATHTVYVSLCVGIPVIGNSGNGFNVYPNPASDIISIAFSSNDEQNYVVRLVDMLGRTVKEEAGKAVNGDNTHIMNLDGIAKAAYMVILQKGDATYKAKLIVE